MKITTYAPGDAPQRMHAVDGIAHFTWFDNETQLAFSWSGGYEEPIEVEEGGYGEPVVAHIAVTQDQIERVQGNLFAPTPVYWAAWFASVCESLVQEVLTALAGEPACIAVGNRCGAPASHIVTGPAAGNHTVAAVPACHDHIVAARTQIARRGCGRPMVLALAQ